MGSDVAEKWKKRWFETASSTCSCTDGNSPPVVLLTEGQDPRVQEAARLLHKRAIARVVMLGSGLPDGLRADGVTVLDPRDVDGIAAATQALFEARRSKGMLAQEAKQLFDSPLYVGAHYLAQKWADVAVSGSISTTAEVIRAGVHVVGKSCAEGTVSSCFVMLLPNGRAVTFADCGVVPKPSAEQLCDIALASAQSHRRFTGEDPLVAFLSFSTLGSAKHDSIDVIQQAISLTRMRCPDLAVDGELQFDAAFVPEVAKRKAPNSKVAGQANVFIFPDLASGNIAYKIAERVGGAIAIGPLLQGLARPWMDLSRGCSAEDIVLVATLACLQASKVN